MLLLCVRFCRYIKSIIDSEWMGYITVNNAADSTLLTFSRKCTVWCGSNFILNSLTSFQAGADEFYFSSNNIYRIKIEWVFLFRFTYITVTKIFAIFHIHLLYYFSPGVVPRFASLGFRCDNDIISMNKDKILGVICPLIDTVGEDEAEATL